MKIVWIAGALVGFTIIAGASLSSKPAQAQQVCTNGSPFTDSNGVSCCTGDLVAGPGGGSVCPGSTQRFSQSSNSLVRGGTVSSTLGGASIRATRSFIGALNDHNEDENTADQTPAPISQPAGILQYTASEPSWQARFPVLARAPQPSPYRFFATSYGGGFSDSAVVSQSGSYYGGLIGVDYRVSPTFLIGAAVGGSGANVSLNSAAGQTHGVNGSIYVIANFGSLYGQSLTTFSSFSNSTTRSAAAVGAATDLEHASFGSFEVRTRAEFGRTFALNDIVGFPKAKVTPFVALEIAQLHLNGHSEFSLSGAGAANSLTTLGQDVADVPAFIGARFEASYDVGHGMVLTPIVRVAYVHQFANPEGTTSNLLAGGGTSFSPNGTLLGRNSAQTKAGFELSIVPGTVVFANFDGLFSSTDSLYGGRGGVRVNF